MKPCPSPLPALLLLVLLAACRGAGAPEAKDAGAGGASQKTLLTVKGSDTMVVLVQRWAEAFMARNPGVQLQVTGGGSGTGFAALLNGTTDLAMASRPIQAKEAAEVQRRHGVGAVERTVAKDGVAFYVYPANPLVHLTAEQLRGIYVGDITNWKQVGGPDARIIVYSRESSSGTYAFVKEHLLGGEDFTAEALTLPGTSAVVHAVSLERHGIGYGGAAFGHGARELPLRVGSEDVAPTQENVASGRYPLSRGLLLYTRGEPTGLARRFVDFALSDEGQALAARAGFFPVR